MFIQFADEETQEININADATMSAAKFETEDVSVDAQVDLSASDTQVDEPLI